MHGFLVVAIYAQLGFGACMGYCCGAGSRFLKYSVNSVLWSSLQKSDLRNCSLVDFEFVVGPYYLTSRFSEFISHSPLLKTR